MVVPSSIPLPSSSRTNSRHGSASQSSRDTRANPSGPLGGHTDLDARSAADRAERRRAKSKWPINPRSSTSALTDSVSTTGHRRDSGQGRTDGASRAGIANDTCKSAAPSFSSSGSHVNSTSSVDHADKSRAAGNGGGQIDCRTRSPIISESKVSLSEPMLHSLSQQSLADKTVRPIPAGHDHRRANQGRSDSDGHRQPPDQPLRMSPSSGKPRPGRMDASSIGGSTYLEEGREEVQDRSSRIELTGESYHRKKRYSIMEPLSMGPRLVQEDQRVENRPAVQQQEAVQPQQTPVYRPTTYEEVGRHHVGNQGRDQERAWHPRADGSEKDEKVASHLKTLLSDSFLSSFTDKLGSSLRKINDRIRDLFSFYELLHRDVVLMKKDICAKDGFLFPLPDLIHSSFDEIKKK